MALAIVAAFGAVYLFRPEFMPYHAVAVGKPWSAVDPAFQVLILGLMRAVGAACLAVVLLGALVLFVPFRQGAAWARWTVPASGLVICAGGLYAMMLVALNTPATPPWIGPAAAAVLFVAGLLLSLGGASPAAASAISRDVPEDIA